MKLGNVTNHDELADFCTKDLAVKRKSGPWNIKYQFRNEGFDETNGLYYSYRKLF